MGRINKYIEYGKSKLKALYSEKKFTSNGYDLKYILEKEDSDILIIVLSGMPDKTKARYNYMRTLEHVKVNKLFILDDLGYDERGGFYLGKDKDFFMERATIELINKVKSDLNTKDTIYCGSSKGGWAAMYFGLRDPNSTVIAGALQYKLGDWFTVTERLRKNTMEYVMGKDYTENDKDYLNNLLHDVLVKNKDNKNKIHLHYSDTEITFERHMAYLLNDLDKYKIPYESDVEHYKSHADIAYYFPSYLIKTLEKEGVQ